MPHPHIFRKRQSMRKKKKSGSAGLFLLLTAILLCCVIVLTVKISDRRQYYDQLTHTPTAVPTYTPRPVSVTRDPASITFTPAPTAILIGSGAKGDHVTKLQQRLAELGYYTGKLDGQYGSGTKQAVTLFQSQHNLSADGIVGEKTYGKGVVQSLFTTSTGTLLKLTTASWYTPSGTSINKEGITPDIEVVNTYDDINNLRDPQLDKAKSL